MTISPSPQPSGIRGHLTGIFTGAFNDNLFKQAILILVTMTILDETLATRWKAGLLVVFILPFLLLAPVAGRLADTVPKHLLIRRLRLAEVGLCLCGGIALAGGHLILLVITLALLGAQSALFSAVKMAAIPELVAKTDLDRANGLVVALTNAAILFGTGFALTMDPHLLDGTALDGFDGPWLLLALALCMAGLGLFGAYRIPPLKPGTGDDVRASFRSLLSSLVSGPGLWQAAAGLAGFWGVGALAMTALPGIAINNYDLSQAAAAMIATVPGIGSMIGALLAPRLNHQGFPGGLALLGASLTGIMLWFAGQTAMHSAADEASLRTFCLLLFGGGIGIGLWTVPLNVLLQQQSDRDLRGRVFAGVGILSILAVLLAAGLAMVAADLGDDGLLAMAGAISVCGALATAVSYRFHLFTWSASLLTHFLYRIELHGLEHLPRRGGCLIICNHISYLDGVALVASLPRQGRFLVFKKYVDMQLIGFPLRAAGAIPVDGGGDRKALVNAIDAAVKAAAAGEVVVIFPEGKITRSGQMDRFQAGMERIAKRAGVPILPAHIHGLFGSVASRTPKRDRMRWRRRVAIRFGTALPSDTKAQEARMVVQQLSYRTAQEQANKDTRTLGTAFLSMVRKNPKATAIVDAQGSLSRRELAAVSRALIPVLELSAQEERVGILLPPGRAGAIANVAITLAGRVAVNLNHTVGETQLKSLIERTGIRTVISAKRYLDRIGIEELPVRTLLAEDLLPRLPKWRLACQALRCAVLPDSWNSAGRSDQTATVIFSSGTTAVPKGIILTHQQLLANIDAACNHLGLGHDNEVILSPLPLFHSFGYSIGMWLGLCKGITIAAHPDPTDAKGLGRMAEQQQATFLIATPTFIRGYQRRVPEEQFAHLRLAVVGAERCPSELKQSFQDKYDAQVLEGFGATELGPVATVNTIDTMMDGVHERGSKDGTVGRPLPGVDIFTVDPDSHEILAPGSTGLLVVRSPARMQGYLDDPERTDAAFVHDGYNTGDMGFVDKDGFVTLTGRLSRFAKIGGEMVPLDQVQESLEAACKKVSGDHEVDLAVASVPDDRRGERLVVLHTDLAESVNADAILAAVEDLPPLFTPKSRDFHTVEALPVLGTGKLDLKALPEMAKDIANG